MTFLGNLLIRQNKTITNVSIGHKFIIGTWVLNYSKFIINNMYIISKNSSTILLNK